MEKCLYCGKEYKKEGKKKYCTRECMQKHWYEKNYVPKEREFISNECIYCGKEFKSKNVAKYCSESCRGKYKRRLKKKYCLNCNKEIDINKSKFCDDNCMNEYYTNNPRYTKTCIQCGNEFKTNTNKQKLCCTDCQHEYEQERRLKVSQKQFKKKFETKYPNFEYMEGYGNSTSMIICRCRICGETQEKSAELARPSYLRELSCDGCIKINKTKRALLNVLMKRYNNLVREQNKAIKEKELEEQRIKRELALASHVCCECGIVFKANVMGQKYCSKECSNKRDNRIKEINRRHKLKKNGKINWDISLSKLIKRDKNVCHICKGKCDKKDYVKNEQGHFIVGPNYPSMDHVIPVSKGGTHTWGNVKLAHHYCNSIKSDNEVYEEGNGQLKMSI